jgi:outer membrane protein assembly factor BamB
MVIISFGSCTPNPKGLLLWDIDFKNDPELSHYGMIFGKDSSVVGDLLVCVRTGGYMFGINKKTGQIKWSYQGSANFQTTPIIENDKIFNISRNGTLCLTILNLSGSLIDEVEYDDYEGNIVGLIPTIYDHKMYFSSFDKILNNWVLATIEMDSPYTIETLFAFCGSEARIISQNDTLYIPYTNNLYSPNDQSGIIAYDLLNEEEKWKTSFGELNGIIDYNPIIHEDKLYVSVDDYVKELDLADGTVLRTFEGQGFDGMTVGDNILFLPDWLYGYDLSTGELSWSQPVYASKDSGSVYHNGVFYFMAYGFSAIDAQSGKYLLKPTWSSGEGPSWEYDNQSGMPLLDDGVIYVNGLRGIYAFNTIGND